MKKLITKKENLKQSVPLMGLMCAICAIMVVFVTYLPVSSIVFTFLLPLPSIIIGLYCKEKYYPIYFVSCLALSCIVGAGDVGYAISAILPSLIIGFFIGFLIKKHFSIYFTFVISSIVLLLLNIASLAVLNYLFNIDLLGVIKSVLNIRISEKFNVLILSFIYMYTLVQTFLILLVSLDQIKFLLKEEKSNSNHFAIEISFSILTILIATILFNFNYSFAFLFLVISYVSGLYFLSFPAKTPLKFIIFLIFGVITWAIFVGLTGTLGIKNACVLLTLLPLSIDIFSASILVYQVFHKENNN